MADEQHPDWITTELRRTSVAERAPSHLRLRIDELSRARSGRPARRLVLIPAAGLIAAVVIALLLVLPGGTPGGPTVAQAASLGAAKSFWGAPPASTSPGQAQTYARFADVRLPSALRGGRWKLVTYRLARLDGRRILILYYSNAQRRIAYSIAAAPLLRGQKSGFTSFTQSGHTVVSWQESDHSCLLTSANASRSTLLTLARS